VINKSAITGFTSGYARHIGRKPWLEAGVLGGGAALVGYHGMNFLVPVFLRALMIGKSDEEYKKALEEIKSDPDSVQLFKNLGAGVGGLAGLAYTAGKHLDWGSGFKGAWDSMKSSGHWDTPAGKASNKVMSENKLKRKKNRLLNAASTGFSSGRGESQKTGARSGRGDPLFDVERIPISYSLNIIKADPFLSLGQKDITGMVLEGAEGSNSGLVSGRDVARSAVHAGVGAAAGLLLGKTMGALLSLPSPVTRRLSAAGVIAGALVNTGLFSELRR
jgi:hypothetical protein